LSVSSLLRVLLSMLGSIAMFNSIQVYLTFVKSFKII
jgi:phosphopantothenoylcysteine synthetase/decarboxylase